MSFGPSHSGAPGSGVVEAVAEGAKGAADAAGRAVDGLIKNTSSLFGSMLSLVDSGHKRDESGGGAGRRRSRARSRADDEGPSVGRHSSAPPGSHHRRDSWGSSSSSQRRRASTESSTAAWSDDDEGGEAAALEAREEGEAHNRRALSDWRSRHASSTPPSPPRPPFPVMVPADVEGGATDGMRTLSGWSQQLFDRDESTRNRPASRAHASAATRSPPPRRDGTAGDEEEGDASSATPSSSASFSGGRLPPEWAMEDVQPDVRGARDASRHGRERRRASSHARGYHKPSPGPSPVASPLRVPGHGMAASSKRPPSWSKANAREAIARGAGASSSSSSLQHGTRKSRHGTSGTPSPIPSPERAPRSRGTPARRVPSWPAGDSAARRKAAVQQQRSRLPRSVSFAMTPGITR